MAGLGKSVFAGLVGLTALSGCVSAEGFESQPQYVPNYGYETDYYYEDEPDVYYAPAPRRYIAPPVYAPPPVYRAPRHRPQQHYGRSHQPYIAPVVPGTRPHAYGGVYPGGPRGIDPSIDPKSGLGIPMGP